MMHDLKRVFSSMYPYRVAFVLAILFVVIETSFELFIPMIMADIIDVGVTTHDINYILYKGVVMAGCALLSLITGLLYAKYAAIAANGFGAVLREREFACIQKYSFSNLIISYPLNLSWVYQEIIWLIHFLFVGGGCGGVI